MFKAKLNYRKYVPVIANIFNFYSYVSAKLITEEIYLFRIKMVDWRKMDGTVRDNIRIGTKVLVVQKQDQGSGKLTEGIVMRVLTNSLNHPRGIKVMLEGGIVGRVQKIL
jgi:uncharacterized repeat protein (TIGR03833 family)